MTFAKFIQYLFWITPGLIQAAITIVMYRRRLHRELPTFFAFTALQTVRFFVLFPLIQFEIYAVYFYAYWAFGALSLITGFAVVREIFFYSFKPYESLGELGKILFRWATAVLILLSIAIAVNTPTSGDMPAALLLFLSCERSVRMTQVGLLIFLLMFSDPLGITGRHRVFGVAFGFGAYAAIEITVSSLLLQFGAGAAPYLSPLKGAAYTFATILWMIYMLRQEPLRVTQGALEPMFSKWNNALMPHFQPAAGQAFISDIDDRVQRILDRNGTH
jgi:hypothetical protein